MADTQTIDINITNLNPTNSATDEQPNENADNIMDEPPPIRRQRTWVDGRVMMTQTNLLIIGYIRTQLVKNHYEPYEIDIVKIIVKSLGDMFNMKRLWNEMTQQKYNILTDWLRMNGAVFENCELKQVNGIYTSSNTIKQGTIFAKIPLDCIITMEIAKKSDIGQNINIFKQTKQIEIRSQHTYIAAYLVIERKKEMQSQWFPYIQSLPAEFNEMPIYFNEENMAQLKGSLTIQKIMNRKESLQAEFDTLKEIFTSYGISYDEFVWGRLIVITRIFGLRINNFKSSGLVPWVDLIDHAPPAPNRVKWTYDNDSDTFIVKANSEMNAGRELFVTYGRKCNSRFFVNYGFILEQQNMENEAVMTFKIRSGTAYNDWRIDRTQNAQEEDFQFSRLYNQRRVKDMFGFLRDFHFTNDETQQIGWNNNVIHPLSITNEKMVLNSLRDAAMNALNNFETTFEFDDELLKNEREYPLKSNKRNIVLMRKGEKEVLMFYKGLQEICTELLGMDLTEMVQKLQNDEMFKDMTSPLMQYIEAVVIPLKQREEIEMERQKEIEIERRKQEEILMQKKQQQQENMDEKEEKYNKLIGKKLEIMNDKMEKMSQQIEELLKLNQQKDEQIKVLGDKVTVLEDKLIQFEKTQNINDEQKQDHNVKDIKSETAENVMSLSLVEFLGSDELNLPQYIEFFVNNGIENINGLKTITDNELEELGIANMGHRRQILNAIQTKL